MNQDYHDLRSAIESAIQSLKESLGHDVVTTIAPIIATNLSRGRVQRYLAKKSGANPEDYVKRVVDHYERQREYVTAVQVTKSDEIWQPLYEQLQKWAYHYLRRRRFPHEGRSSERFEHAVTCATETAGVLIKAHFPYDINFDPWAAVVLQHVCQKHIKKFSNPSRYPEEGLVALDAWDEWLANIPDLDSLEGQHQAELRCDLLNAIEQMTETKKQFILLCYFDNKTFKEISVLLDKRVNALYKVHFDALIELRKILNGNWDKYE